MMLDVFFVGFLLLEVGSALSPFKPKYPTSLGIDPSTAQTSTHDIEMHRGLTLDALFCQSKGLFGLRQGEWENKKENQK